MTQLPGLENFAATWLDAITRASLIGGIAIIFAWCITRVFSGMPSSIRDWVWRLAYLKLLLAFAWAMPIELPLLPAPAATSELVEIDRAELVSPVRSKIQVESETARDSVGSYDRSAKRPSISRSWWKAPLFLTWCLGVVIASFRLFRTLLAARKLKASARPDDNAQLKSLVIEIYRRIGVTDGPQLRSSESAIIPQLCGVLSPVVILPTTLITTYSAPEARSILAHEIAHWQRRDLLWNWLPASIQVVFYFHPAVWLAQREWRFAQEAACDEAAIEISRVSATDYGHTLLKVVQSYRDSVTASLFSVAVSHSYKSLTRRIAAIRTVDGPRKVRPTISLALALVAAIGLIPWKLTASEPETAADTGDGTISNSQMNDTGSATDPTRQLAEGVIAGILVDTDGSPVSGAKVLLIGGSTEDTESDASGRFRFENCPPAQYGYRLQAYSDNLITGRIDVEELSNKEGVTNRYAPLKLTMEAGKQVELLVTSKEDGDPISAAVVKCSYPDRREVPTGPDGRSVIRGLMPEKYEITVELAGFAREVVYADLAASGERTDIEVALAPGGEVDGTVVDDQGNPVADAEVHYSHGGSTGYWGDSSRTDANGKFHYASVPLEMPVEVSARKDDHVRSSETFALTRDERSKKLTVILPRRTPGPSVVGKVTGPDGTPVANAEIENYGNGSSPKRRTSTDSDGGFKLDDLHEDYTGFRFVVSGTGLAPKLVQLANIAQDEPYTVNVVLEPGHAIRGRVVHEDGSPVEKASVTVRHPAYPMGMKNFYANEQGEFAIDSLPADVRFEVRSAGYPFTEAAQLELDAPDSITVMLKEPGVVAGNVVDSRTKQPIEQFNVRIGFSRDMQPGDARGSYDGTFSEPGLTVKDSEGRFRISPLVVGMPVELIVEAAGFEKTVVPRVVAQRASEIASVVVELEPKVVQDPYALSVKFVDSNGKPLPNVHLRLISSTEPPKGKDDNAYNWVLIETEQLGDKSYVEQYLPGKTDATGQFTFDDLIPERFLQLAYWGEGVPKGRTLSFDETRAGQSDQVEVKIASPASIRGTVNRVEMPDAASVQVQGTSESFLRFETKLKPGQTEFELSDLPAGRFWVAVTGKPISFTEDGHQMYRIPNLASQEIELKSGEEKTLRFDAADRQR